MSKPKTPKTPRGKRTEPAAPDPASASAPEPTPVKTPRGRRRLPRPDATAAPPETTPVQVVGFKPKKSDENPVVIEHGDEGWEGYIRGVDGGCVGDSPCEVAANLYDAMTFGLRALHMYDKKREIVIPKAVFNRLKRDIHDAHTLAHDAEDDLTRARDTNLLN